MLDVLATSNRPLPASAKPVRLTLASYRRLCQSVPGSNLLRSQIASMAVANYKKNASVWAQAYRTIQLDPSDFKDFLMGFEFEFISCMDRGKLCSVFVEYAKKLESFVFSGEHEVVSGDYHGARRQARRWIFEGDGSIRTSGDHPHCCELVTPPLQLRECFGALAIIHAFIEVVGTVNASCGLHFTMGHKDISRSLDVLGLFKEFDQAKTLALFDRTDNSYCAPAHLCDYLPESVSDHSYFKGKSIHLVKEPGAKYRAINLNKTSNGLVELRAMGGPSYLSDTPAVVSTVVSFASAMHAAVCGTWKRKHRNFRQFCASVREPSRPHFVSNDSRFPFYIFATYMRQEHLLDVLDPCAAEHCPIPVLDSEPSDSNSTYLLVNKARAYASMFLVIRGRTLGLRFAFDSDGTILVVICAGDDANFRTRTSELVRAHVLLSRNISALLSGLPCRVMFDGSLYEKMLDMYSASRHSNRKGHGFLLRFLAKNLLQGDRAFFGNISDGMESVAVPQDLGLDNTLRSSLSLMSSGIRPASYSVGSTYRGSLFADISAETQALRGSIGVPSFVGKIRARLQRPGVSVEGALTELYDLALSSSWDEVDLFPVVRRDIQRALTTDKSGLPRNQVAALLLMFACTVAMTGGYSRRDKFSQLLRGLHETLSSANFSQMVSALPDIWYSIGSVEKECGKPTALSGIYASLVTFFFDGSTFSSLQLAETVKLMSCMADHPVTLCFGNMYAAWRHREFIQAVHSGLNLRVIRYNAHHTEGGLTWEQYCSLLRMYLCQSSSNNSKVMSYIRDGIHSLGESLVRNADHGTLANKSLFSRFVRHEARAFLATGNTSHLIALQILANVHPNFTSSALLVHNIPGVRVGLFGDLMSLVRFGWSASRLFVGESVRTSWAHRVFCNLHSRLDPSGYLLKSTAHGKTSFLRSHVHDAHAARAVAAYLAKQGCYVDGVRVPDYRVLYLLGLNDA